jgi:hypothetical protein
MKSFSECPKHILSVVPDESNSEHDNGADDRKEDELHKCDRASVIF